MAVGQWATGKPLFGQLPQWVLDTDDQARLASYELYEKLFRNVPEAFKLIQRGSDTKPIYVPAAKSIVNTMQRFLAPGVSVIADAEIGSEGEQANANAVWRTFARRERVYSRFASNKRMGLIRGDWLFHIVADEEREAGSRVSLLTLDPSRYFPITDPDDLSVVIGCHIVEEVIADGKPAIYRQTYRKTTETGGPSPITLESAIYESGKWGYPEGSEEKLISIESPPTLLPSDIMHIPVYHMRNGGDTESMWGYSELSGLERLIAAISQGISDEELELVLNGLGVYVTDAGSPVDADGNPAQWNLGPAKVIELPNGKTFQRVSGTQSVEPYQAHLKYLHEQLDEAAGIPAVAKGKVNVEVAESGIALALELGPIFASAEEKELEITDVMSNMLFDLRSWLQVYDGINIGEAVWVPKYGDRIPQNRKERFKQLMEMATATTPIVSAQWLRKELSKIGFEFPDDTTMMEQILEEKQMVGQIEADVIGSRIDSELNAGEEDDDDADADA